MPCTIDTSGLPNSSAFDRNSEYFVLHFGSWCVFHVPVGVSVISKTGALIGLAGLEGFSASEVIEFCLSQTALIRSISSRFSLFALRMPILMPFEAFGHVKQRLFELSDLKMCRLRLLFR